jgi:hypothetical protein
MQEIVLAQKEGYRQVLENTRKRDTGRCWRIPKRYIILSLI